jgi:VWFA-related protein
MEELLAKLEGKADGKVAGELGELQLTERVSAARLARWEAKFPGERARRELIKLADRSVFLDSPAADVIPDPPPDQNTQRHMLWMAEQYAGAATSRLPDLIATRETTHFEANSSRTGDSVGGGIPSMQWTGVSSRTVTYRNGSEVAFEVADKQEPALGLTTDGEFGPILAQILSDAAEGQVGFQGQVGFERWEQGPSEPAAVFHYAVPADASHFEVNIAIGNQAQTIHPAYHGEIEIDPATGEILRLSEVADPAPPHEGMRAAKVVEYAPVNIGDRSYICPVKSVAFSTVPVPSAAAADELSGPVQVNLNDVVFTHYHEFGSEARIVANASGGGNAPSGSGAPEADTSESTATASPPAVPTAPSSTGEAAGPASGSAPPAATEEAPVTAASNPAPNPASEAAAATATSPTANPSGDATDASATSAPAGAVSKAPATGTVLHAQSRLVVLDVEVTDHDKPVEGLDRSRFHVLEDGHEVPIASFEENEPPASVEIAKAPTLPPDTYSNVPVYPETSAVNVLLLDALNTPMGDQAQVRKQMIAYLSTIKPGTALAIFTLSSRLRMVAGFTTDVAMLKQALESRKPNARSSADIGANSSESISSSLVQAASSVATSNDPGTRWLVGQIMQFAADTETYETDQRATMTLDALSELARYLTAIPGKKNLIWFSGSFPIGLSPDAMLRAPVKNINDYSIEVQRTSTLLSAARVSVYPVDARGLTMAPTVDSSYTPPLATMQSVGPVVANDNNNFSMQTSQDQGTMSTIAAETGGHAYMNGNGLKEAVEKIVAEGSSYYALSYVPPEETGGKHGAEFHKIEVKVEGSKYQLAYRQGYYSDVRSKAADSSGGVPGPMTAAAVLGAPPSTQILFQVRALPLGDPELTGPLPGNAPAGDKAASLKGGAHRFIVDLSVDPKSLTFAEGADGRLRTQLDCALVIYDGEGKPVNSLGRSFDLHLSPEQYQQLLAAGGTVPMRLAMGLPAGDSVLRIVLHEPVSARTGSLEIPVRVAGK